MFGGTWVCEGEKELVFELEGLRELLTCLPPALHFNCAKPCRRSGRPNEPGCTTILS